MKKFRTVGRLEIVAFVTGFSLLTFELVAARILAPTIGSSTYVWTSVIGVIIAALSLGFFIGGWLADQRSRTSDVVWLLIGSALTVVVTKLLYESLLVDIANIDIDLRLQAVIASLVLFAPTSLLIGITSPYLAKLNVHSLHTSGRAVASLDMFNALGGISGTFITGFILFGYVGSRQSLALIVGLLIASSWLLVPRYRWGVRLFFGLALMSTAVLPVFDQAGRKNIDTATANYQIEQQRTVEGGELTTLATGPGGLQSAAYHDSSRPVFWYNQQIAKVALERRPERILVLGGGAFTLPQYLAQKLPSSQIDVVEIDPGLKEISEQYFNYDNPKNVQLVFDDARHYVNESRETYDMIVVDVYGDTSIPFSLMTREYTRALAERLAPEGVVLANLIVGQRGGPCEELFAALDAAYRSQFSQGWVTTQSGNLERRANHVVMYSRVSQSSTGLDLPTVFNSISYSDNFAPAERLYFACLNDR